MGIYVETETDEAVAVELSEGTLDRSGRGELMLMEVMVRDGSGIAERGHRGKDSDGVESDRSPARLPQSQD